MKFLGFFSIFLSFSGICLGQTTPEPAEKLATGQVLERVVCAKNPDQSYALYLPSKYVADRAWPVVLIFDPGARGKLPVELMRGAAERYGYIVLGSNNSRNGAWKPEADAADAMLQDAQFRFSVDLKRIYFAGFSGGARVASQLAQICNCSAGVLLSGAGFSQNSPPLRDTAFPVFSTVGNLDFNYSELIPLQDKLDQAGYPHWLRVFDGTHEWAPGEVMEEALAWFRIQAIHNNREPHDEIFLAAELKNEIAVAEKFLGNGYALAAWRQYKQIAASYEGLADVSPFRAKSEELGRAKSVQDALKRERNDLMDQEHLSNQILGTLQAKENFEMSRSEGREDVTRDVRELRQRAESEKKPERAVVLKRALAGIFVGAIESGSSDLEKKDYAGAARYFAAAAEARQDSEWALRRLAVAQALNKDRRAALETLHRIKPADPAEFQSWQAAEPAFQTLREKHELPL